MATIPPCRAQPAFRVGCDVLEDAVGSAARETAAGTRIRNPGAAPTVRQVYALAGVLCERLGEEWPATRADASAVIERLRVETGHPSPRLEDCRPGRGGRRKRPYPWWQHIRHRKEDAVSLDDILRDELVRAARERLRERLADEAETLAAAGADALVADVHALVEQLSERPDPS